MLNTPQIPPVYTESLVDKSVLVFVGVLKNHIVSLSHATGVERGAEGDIAITGGS